MAIVQKSTKKTGGRKKTSARRSSSKVSKKEMPHWQYVAIAILTTAVILFLGYHLLFKGVLNRFTQCAGTKSYGICIPEGHEIFGIDISHYQGSIDWEALKNGSPDDSPVSFIYMKATEGSDHKDRMFDRNWTKALEHGFTRGAYHYFSLHSSGLAQAEMFIKNVKLEKGDLPPMVDVEEEPKDKREFLQELKIFIAKIEKHYGTKPIVYSGKKYKERHLNDRYFDRYPTWIAHYYVDSLDVENNWTFWQCSDKGRLPGIRHKVDINVFNGDSGKLESLKIKQ